MLRSATLFFVALIAVSALAAGRAVAEPSPAAALDAAIRAEVPRGFSGAVLIARNDTIILDQAYGVERGQTVQRSSRFWIASIGKQFVSAAILKCRDRGLLSLDDPLSRFFPAAPADKAAITVRQLLSYTSGYDQTYVAEEEADRDHAVPQMLAVKLVDAPGAKFHYANVNFQLATAIIEVVSGMDYKVFVARELFQPAGLHDTGFAGPGTTQTVALTNGDLPARLTRAHWGPEGVFSTASDLLRWYRALADGRVLSRRSADELFAPVTPIGEGQGALGWFIAKPARDQTAIFTRGNDDYGANALIYAYRPSGVTVIVLSHAGNAIDDQSWSRFVLAKIEAIVFP